MKPISPGLRKLIKKLANYTVAQNGGVISPQRTKATIVPRRPRR